MGIIIAHKFNDFVHKASNVLVLDRGCLVEIGTHIELLEQRGIYHKMYHLQNND